MKAIYKNPQNCSSCPVFEDSNAPASLCKECDKLSEVEVEVIQFVKTFLSTHAIIKLPDGSFDEVPIRRLKSVEIVEEQ